MRIHERNAPGALGVLGTEETLGCTGNTGMLWNWVPSKHRDAPGTPGILRTDGMIGSSGSIRIPGGTGMLQEHWDVWEQREHRDGAGWSGMRREPRDAAVRSESSSSWLPGRTTGPRRRDTERPSIPGSTGRREFRDGTRLSQSPQPPGTGRGRIPAHFPWERHQRGPPSAQSHQPSRKNPERRRDAGMLGRLDVNAWNVISGHGPG